MSIPRRNMGSTPRVGVEIEVVHWGKLDDTTPRDMRCEFLMSEGLMHAFDEQDPTGLTPFSEQHHTYGCTCMICSQWITEDSDPYPVQFTLEYDGTLPMYGGEFISSPFPMMEEYVDSFLKGWNIITDGAVRQFDVPSKNHPTSSPSVHVHASCFNPNNYDPNVITDFTRAFAPEIYAMGLAGGLDRGYEYRHIDYNTPASKDYGHHRVMNTMHMRVPEMSVTDIHSKYPNLKPDGAGRMWSGPHIEVRTWEADYDNHNYILAALHTSAGLAQVMSSSKIVEKMLGYTMLRGSRTIDPKRIHSTQQVLELVDKSLFQILITAIKDVSYVSFWEDAYNSVTWLADNVEKEVF